MESQATAQRVEDPKEKSRRVRREWYMKNREEHKTRALERYYENQEENKARNRIRAQQRKARLETLEASLRQRALDVEELERETLEVRHRLTVLDAENALLKTKLDSRESNTDTHISDLVCV